MNQAKLLMIRKGPQIVLMKAIFGENISNYNSLYSLGELIIKKDIDKIF